VKIVAVMMMMSINVIHQPYGRPSHCADPSCLLSDILEAVDETNLATLALFDLSTAFDHAILLRHPPISRMNHGASFI